MTWKNPIRYMAILAIASLAGCAGTPSVVVKARADVGSHFRKGESAQCANYVADVMRRAHIPTPRAPALVMNWRNWGTPVPWALKKPGDVIVTWRNSPRSGEGHILIYVGNGKCVHRSTYKSPVKFADVDDYKPRLLTVRRPPANSEWKRKTE